MKRRSFRHVLLAAAAVTAGLVIVTATGDAAGAATFAQPLDCGIGGTQTANVAVTAPASAASGETYRVTIAPSGPAGTASGAEIKNMVTTFAVPSSASIVAGSAKTVAGTGSGTLGATTVTVSGQTISLKVPGPIANGASFVNPSLQFDLKATGAVASVVKVTFRQSAGYTLTAAGSINVTCNATTPLAALTSTTITAATTTSTTAASTTTTGGGSTTSTTAGPTTTTTTAPPVLTNQTWSPGTACGVGQSITAPANTTSVAITAIGGKGGRSGEQASSDRADGGIGGQAFGTFAASGGQVFSAVVGCNGADGQSGIATSASAAGWSFGGNTGNGYIVIGQPGAGGGGGGASSGVCLGPECAVGSGTPLVVAGGGGGGGVSNCAGTGDTVGDGGNGGNGANSTGDGGFGPRGLNGEGGAGGGSINGGAGGVNTDSPNSQGGSSPSTGPLDGLGLSVVGGAGGGGYAGGTQGQNANTGCKRAGGGGGGSSWVKNTASNATFSTSPAAAVTLTFTISTPTTTTTSSTTTSTSTSTTSTTSTTAPCVTDKAPFLTVSGLVTQQYLDFTGALPTTANTNQWVPAITLCTNTADNLIVSLLPTDLTSLDDARLVRLYLAYFKRPPDPTGFAYWQRQLDAGKGLINAAKKFAESSEFKRTYGSLSNGDFIDLVYLNVLERTPDSSGRAFWLTRLDAGTKNRGDVMINFSESSENVSKKSNHVQVFRLFRGMMARFPSKTEYFALLDPITNNGKALTDASKAIRLSASYDARVI